MVTLRPLACAQTSPIFSFLLSAQSKYYTYACAQAIRPPAVTGCYTGSEVVKFSIMDWFLCCGYCCYYLFLFFRPIPKRSIILRFIFLNFSDGLTDANISNRDDAKERKNGLIWCESKLWHLCIAYYCRIKSVTSDRIEHFLYFYEGVFSSKNFA